MWPAPYQRDKPRVVQIKYCDRSRTGSPHALHYHRTNLASLGDLVATGQRTGEYRDVPPRCYQPGADAVALESESITGGRKPVKTNP